MTLVPRSHAIGQGEICAPPSLYIGCLPSGSPIWGAPENLRWLKGRGYDWIRIPTQVRQEPPDRPPDATLRTVARHPAGIQRVSDGNAGELKPCARGEGRRQTESSIIAWWRYQHRTPLFVAAGALPVSPRPDVTIRPVSGKISAPFGFRSAHDPPGHGTMRGERDTSQDGAAR